MATSARKRPQRPAQRRQQATERGARGLPGPWDAQTHPAREHTICVVSCNVLCAKYTTRLATRRALQAAADASS